MRAVVLIGAPGVGKSTVLTRLADRLELEGVPHAVVEVESLARAFPYPALAQALDALPRVVTLHRAAGHELLLAAATPEDQAELDALRAAVGCSDTTVVRLDAPPDVGVARVTAREPPDWRGLPKLQETARVLGDRLGHLVGVDHVIQTHRSAPGDVVAEIRRLTGV